MFQRNLKPILNRSFFLFGARGTGKTSWLQSHFQPKDCYWIDLLDEDLFERYSLTPQILDAELLALEDKGKRPKFVIIDEVQRVPRLLNVVQKWIQKNKYIFILTGSSARKLKRGFANLLGGRANNYGLFPLCTNELKKQFDLQSALEWGTLPEIFSLQTEREKKSYLKSYCNNYLKEEILVEQLIRKLPPFRKFLSILAQHDGKLINFEKFSRDIGVDNKTVQSYIDILEETYLGILLRPHHPSLRKSQLQMPKFYYFDTGVQRQLSGVLGTPLTPSTSAFGMAFESFLIQEIHRLNSYYEHDYELTFLHTKNGFEVDLILTKGPTQLFIEIKSTEKIDPVEVKALDHALVDLKKKATRIIYLSRAKKKLVIGNVECLHYSDFLSELTREGI